MPGVCGSPGAVGVVGGSGKESSWPAVGVGVGGVGGVRKGKFLAGSGCRCWRGGVRTEKNPGRLWVSVWEGGGSGGEKSWPVVDVGVEDGERGMPINRERGEEKEKNEG